MEEETFETGQQSNLTPPLSLSLSPQSYIHTHTVFHPFIRSSAAPTIAVQPILHPPLPPLPILYPSFGGKASIIQAVGNCDRRILLESDTLACLLNKWWNNIFKTPIIRGRVSPSPYGGPVFIGPWSINAAKKEERSFIGVVEDWGEEEEEEGEPRSIFTLQSRPHTSPIPDYCGHLYGGGRLMF